MLGVKSLRKIHSAFYQMERCIEVDKDFKGFEAGTSEQLGIWYGYSIETIVFITP